MSPPNKLEMILFNYQYADVSICEKVSLLPSVLLGQKPNFMKGHSEANDMKFSIGSRTAGMPITCLLALALRWL